MNALDSLMEVLERRRFGEDRPWPATAKAAFTRRLLCTASREGVHLRHGTVKHARDTIRYVERREARLVR